MLALLREQVYAATHAMSFHDLLGRFVTLTVDRLTPQGAYLTDAEPVDGPGRSLLLPRSETAGLVIGDAVEVFVYLDSADRPIATRHEPKLTLDEVAFLEVTDITEVGAFVDWGLVKELLVPFARQTRDLRIGDRHPIGLYVDSSGRLAGTMRVSELLKDVGEFEQDEWVEGEAWRQEPGIGVFVIVERTFVGLLPEHEPHQLRRGDEARFRVSNVLRDGRIELSLRGHAHQELEADAQRLLAFLAKPDSARIGDRSSPEEIMGTVRLSKKAFKRAAGRLLKRGEAMIDPDGWLALPKRSR